MAFEFHKNPQKYLQHQYLNTLKSTIPFIKTHHTKAKNYFDTLNILELGCGEGGNLLPFAEMGANCVGIDLNKVKIEQGKNIMADVIKSGKLTLYYDDIFNPEIEAKFTNRFDIILLKDVIEHIPHKDKALEQMKKYLNDDGLLFVGFPPWYMPFGGHQQICNNRFLGVLPWMHLLPKSLYIGFVKCFDEPKNVTDELAELVDFGVTINHLHRLANAVNLKIVARQYYFINPIYEYKFGFKTRLLSPILANLPYVRDFLTTSAYYLLGK